MKLILLLVVGLIALLVIGFVYHNHVSKRLNVDPHAAQEIEKAKHR